MTDLVTLTFVNRDADSTEELKVQSDAVHLVARWYGSHCAGDDYDILIDGELAEKDVNGEIYPIN